jgi:hypothetical protein
MSKIWIDIEISTKHLVSNRKIILRKFSYTPKYEFDMSDEEWNNLSKKEKKAIIDNWVNNQIKIDIDFKEGIY